ncbi:MAG: hypothetical protein J6I47_03085 [Ruminococcus sp.]|nr:hypothetical protein [Ruminococcus sp.]
MAQTNANVKSINTIGKVFRIITIIAKILVIIGFVVSLIIGIAVLTVPDDAIDINANCNATIRIDRDDIPDSLIKVEESNDKWDIMGIKLKLKVRDTKIDDDNREITVAGTLNDMTAKELKIMIAGICFAAAVTCVFLYIALIFGGTLAKALAKCETPFSDEVIKAMCSFGKSLIPIGVIAVICGAEGIGVMMLVLIILLFIHIIKYGADIQKGANTTNAADKPIE